MLEIRIVGFHHMIGVLLGIQHDSSTLKMININFCHPFRNLFGEIRYTPTIDSWIPFYSFGGFLSHRGTPSSHLILMGFFSINHPAIGDPPV